MTDNQTPSPLLRESVRQLDRSEKLALAAFLVTQCNPRFVSVIHTAEPVFGENLDVALAATGDFTQEVKLFFAIELLSDLGKYDGDCDIDSLPDRGVY